MTNPYLKKRSLRLSGHRTSVALEQEFWNILEEIARSKQKTVALFIAEIDMTRDPEHPLSSVLRILSLQFALYKQTSPSS